MQPPLSPPGAERAPVTHARRARGAYAVALAVVCFAVLATHVHLGFERIRIRVVASPLVASEPTLGIALPDLTPLAGAPAAIIARVSGGGEPTRLALALDDTTLAVVEAPANAETRIDASASITGGRGHSITMSSDRTGWRLDSLEVANVHGFSAGALSFVVVPRGHAGNPRMPWWLAAIIGAGLLVLRPWPVASPGLTPRRPEGVPAVESFPNPRRSETWRPERAARILTGASAGLVLLVFAVVLLADIVSPYRILLSPTTFAILAAILYVRPIVRVVPPLVSWLARATIAGAGAVWSATRAGASFIRRSKAPQLLPHITVIVLVLWGVARFHQPENGFTSFIRFGQAFSGRAVPALGAVPHAVESPYGYDAQFYAQLALDPLLQDPATVRAIDTPLYRARRVFLPWLANVLALGEPWYILQVYALLNVAAWLWMAWLLLRWLPPGSAAATAAWIAIMLSHGFMASMARALADGPSALIIALGVTAVHANRQWLAAAILGVSGLTRETNLLAAAALLPAEKPAPNRLVALAVQGLAVVAPLALWVAYLVSLGLPPEAAGAGNFAAPLVAYVNDWIAAVEEARLYASEFDAWLAVLTLVALTTQALALLWWRAWRDPWWRAGVGYVLLMLVLGPAVWEGQPSAVTRVVLPMTVAFNVLLPRGRWFWPLWILGNANLLHAPREMGLDWFL
ncbi:MAG: hypothetical protein IT177_00100 [Acidobacteria bacterium]|nr:hypothetical protein [Acidobacteriota bacterium]